MLGLVHHPPTSAIWWVADACGPGSVGIMVTEDHSAGGCGVVNGAGWTRPSHHGVGEGLYLPMTSGFQSVMPHGET